MHLDPFTLHRPATVDETVALAGRLGPGSFDYLAGGTDLLPNYKMHLNLRPNLIALWDLAELGRHDLGRLGAMTRLADLEADREFAGAFPGVAEAVGQVATPLVRASGTVGGNLLLETRCFFFNQSFPWRQSLGFCLKADGDRCHVVPQRTRCYATFSGDLAPALQVLDARVELAGPDGRRSIGLTGLYDAAGDGIRRLALAPGELLVAVEIPPEARGMRATYAKLRIRPSFDFPELGVAAAAEVDDGRVRRLRVAVGGLETYPRRFDELTQPLEGAPLSPERIRELAAAIGRAVRPVHNTFLAPDYRKRMTAVFVRRALERVARGEAG
jgi:4-hydroxybenzoyl-CoA reductase subunit beta